MTDGQKMGCRDSGPPEIYTDEQLSRAADLLRAIKAHVRNVTNEQTVHCNCKHGCNHIEEAVAEEEKRMFIACVPRSMRFEMTWSSWTYRSK